MVNLTKMESQYSIFLPITSLIPENIEIGHTQQHICFCLLLYFPEIYDFGF
mgnify:CR=1 FL=1